MTVYVDISEDLVEWASQAGLHVTQGAQRVSADGRAGDGRTVLWTNRGEARYFIGAHPSEWFTVSGSERMAAEELKFAAESMRLIELYFYGKCGRLLRSNRRLPLLRYPRTADDVAPGYVLGSKTFDGQEYRALVNSDGSAVAISAFGKIMATAELALLSVHLRSSLQEFKASYLDPSGQPLFTLREA